MAAQCMEKTKHQSPTCKSTSGKSLQIYLNDDDTYTGYCFACSVFVKNPYGDEGQEVKHVHAKKTDEQYEEEVKEVAGCPYINIVDYRSIDLDNWKYFGVRQLLSEYDGTTPWAIAHPYTKNKKVVRWKVKLIAKKGMFWIGNPKDKDVDPYGWERAVKLPGSTLYITEGEEDAISVRKILRDSNRNTDYAALDFPVISLPDGGGSVHALKSKLPEINARWNKVVLCFDQDETGKKAIDEALMLFPDAHVAPLPLKDANECLKQGRVKAARDALIFKAEKPRPSGILRMEDYGDSLLDDMEMGYSFPWQTLTEMTMGQRAGEILTIGGGMGVGKSTFVDELIHHDMEVHNWNVFGIILEGSIKKHFRNIAGKFDNIPYGSARCVVDKDYTREQLEKTFDKFKKKYSIWDRSKLNDSFTSWEGIKEDIRMIGGTFQLLVLDNLTVFTEDLNPSDKNTFLGKMSRDLSILGKQFGFFSVVVSHLNEPEKSGRSHNNGGKVLMSQWAGGRAFPKYCDISVGFERNSLGVDPNCSLLRLLKNREEGDVGIIKTYYDKHTGRLIEYPWEDDQYKDINTGANKK